MIKKFDKYKRDEVMDIWIETNKLAHDFIDESYWMDNYNIVREMLPSANIMIYEEDIIKGFIGIIEDGYIAGLFVRKEFQGLGIGKKLINKAKDNYVKLTLDVYEKNFNAVNFYKKNGFKVIDKKKNKYTDEIEYTMKWIR